jgi:hypothetical protein
MKSDASPHLGGECGGRGEEEERRREAAQQPAPAAPFVACIGMPKFQADILYALRIYVTESRCTPD